MTHRMTAQEEDYLHTLVLDVFETYVGKTVFREHTEDGLLFSCWEAERNEGGVERALNVLQRRKIDLKWESGHTFEVSILK